MVTAEMEEQMGSVTSQLQCMDSLAQEVGDIKSHLGLLTQISTAVQRLDEANQVRDVVTDMGVGVREAHSATVSEGG